MKIFHFSAFFFREIHEIKARFQGELRGKKGIIRLFSHYDFFVFFGTEKGILIFFHKIQCPSRPCKNSPKTIYWKEKKDSPRPNCRYSSAQTTTTKAPILLDKMSFVIQYFLM